MTPIRFEAQPYQVAAWTIIRLPKAASAGLASRGQVMVEGTINQHPFQTPLEPDGKGSHWFRLDHQLSQAAHVQPGDTVHLSLHPSPTWPEPTAPADLAQALAAHQPARRLWAAITPMARWEWIRWIRATSRLETRQRRIQVALSKLEAGERRPCCWNRNLCTEPAVSRNGALIEPDQARAS